LVSSSVQDMDPDQVTVADSSGQVLSAPGTGITAAAGDARSQVELEYEGRLADNAQQILDRVLGPGHAEVSVRADVDLSQRDTTSETYTYEPGTPPVSESTTTEDYTGSGGPRRGEHPLGAPHVRAGTPAGLGEHHHRGLHRLGRPGRRCPRTGEHRGRR